MVTVCAMSGIRHSTSTPCTRARLNSSSYLRTRSRQRDVSYERSKDTFSHSIGTWTFEETCCMLALILARARLRQLEHLWTAMEPTVHRDFLTSPEACSPGVPLRPYSTPITREIRQRLSRSRRPENQNLYRVSSATIAPEISTLRSATIAPEVTRAMAGFSLHERCKSENHLRTAPEATPSFKLPGLHLESHRRTVPLGAHISAQPSSPVSAWSSYVPTSRIPFPQKRHMVQGEGPEPHLLSHMGQGECPEPHLLSPKQLPHSELPLGGLHLLRWFSNLTEDWQQQEILQILVWNLDSMELHYFTALLKLHQYKDFISELPEGLSLHVLEYVPAKELLRSCCRVSSEWHKRFCDEKLWKVKCQRNRIDLPMQRTLSWRQTFIEDLKLKRNWRRKKCVVQCFQGHIGRVLCVRIRGEDNLIATGGSDRTVRLWNADNGECTGVLTGHMKPVWCLCFLGKNLLVSGSGDSSLKIWNTSTGVCGRHLDGHRGPVWAVQIKKNILISGSHDHTAVIWDVRCCSVLRVLEGHSGAVFSVDLDESTELAFTASGDKTIGVWQVSTGQCLKRLKPVAGVGHPVVALQWHKDYIASCAGNVVYLWSMDGWKKVMELQGHEDRVECVQLRVRDHPDSCVGMILSSSRDKTIKYWDIHSGRCLQTLAGHTGPVNSISWNEVFVASASDDSNLRIWDFHPCGNRIGFAPS